MTSGSLQEIDTEDGGNCVWSSRRSKLRGNGDSLMSDRHVPTFRGSWGFPVIPIRNGLGVVRHALLNRNRDIHSPFKPG